MDSVKGTTGMLSGSSHAVVALPARGKVQRNPGKRLSVNPRLVCLLRPKSVDAERYFRLRLALENLSEPGRGYVVGVTSPGAGDGKTLTAINLAGALAQNPKARILLVDMNLREPDSGVRDYLDIKAQPGPGLADWIANPGLSMNAAIQHLPMFNLHVMFAGGTSDLPYELLQSSRLDQLLEVARQHYDFVILDTPQVLRLPDNDLISRLVDGFLIVIRAGSTSKQWFEEALNLMMENKVLGLVLNGVSDPH